MSSRERARILHVAPFDPGRFPPLINTIRIADGWADSLVVASAPAANPEAFPNLVAPDAPGSGAKQLAFLANKVQAAMDSWRPDLVIGHNVRGAAVARWASDRRTRCVYHCHDFETGVHRANPVVSGWERIIGETVDEIWVPAVERARMARERQLSAPIRIVQNTPPLLRHLPRRGSLRRYLREVGAPSEFPIIVRHGRIGRSHYLQETVWAMARAQIPSTLVVIGDGDDEYIRVCLETARQLGLADRVRFHPFVAHWELPDLLIDATVAMNVYSRTGINEAAPAPNKVYETMALAVPSIVAAGNSVEADVVGNHAGWSIPLGDIDALASVLHEALGPGGPRAGEHARAAHLGRFNYERQHESTLLDDVRRSVAPRARSGDRAQGSL